MAKEKQVKKKDWTGNTRSVFSVMGSSSHSETDRQRNDFYATDPLAIDKLREVYAIPQYVWECACGAGHLSGRLLETGYNVLSTDLIDHGYGHVGIDFLKEKHLPEFLHGEDCCVLTNPPFKYATEFVEHALKLLPEGQPAIFLLKTIALEGKGRYERLYRNGYLHAVYQFTERLMCAKNGDFDSLHGSAVSYAWFVFRKERCEAPVIGWI